MEESRKKIKHKILVYSTWLVCGLILLALAIAGVVEGEFFVPFSIAWSAVSLSRILRYSKMLKSDSELREYMLFENDERNLMIKRKAISYTAYIIIFISLIAIIAAEILGNFVISATIACMVCLFVIIYTIIALVLRRKY